jgi:hypothetical protein
MHIARETPHELVVVSGTRWLSAIVGAAAVGSLYFVIPRRELAGYFVTAFLAAFALIMDLRKTFTFDAMQRVVHWKAARYSRRKRARFPLTPFSTSAGNRSPPKIMSQFIDSPL